MAGAGHGRRWCAPGACRCCPERAELLAEVAAAGIPHALVTSAEREIMDAVLRGIGVHFPATVCAADVTRGKPDPEPYLRAAALLAAEPRRCVALEDSPNGVASAHAAGCAVIAVPSVPPPPGLARLDRGVPGRGRLATLRMWRRPHRAGTWAS